MINAIFFGINVLLLIVIWNYMLKKTLLDHYRDQLFDLREEAREFFLKNNIPLDSNIYKRLRDLLNGHLRFTERFTFIRFIILEVEIKNNKELHEHLKKEMEDRFSTDNQILNDFVVQTRKKATIAILNHMVNSSGLVWLFVFSLAPVFITWNFIRAIRYLIKVGVTTLTNSLYCYTNIAIKFIFTINYPITKSIKQDLLEECSYQVGAKYAAAAY
ncbi:MAG: hypothetical protein PHP70_01975 [Gallionella sp.]|nr:hypothetical protein [Gallionella sp.]